MIYILFTKFSHFIEDLDQLISACSKSKMEEVTRATLRGNIQNRKKTCILWSLYSNQSPCLHRSKHNDKDIKNGNLVMCPCCISVMQNSRGLTVFSSIYDVKWREWQIKNVLYRYILSISET